MSHIWYQIKEKGLKMKTTCDCLFLRTFTEAEYLNPSSTAALVSETSSAGSKPAETSGSSGVETVRLM